MMWWYGGWGWWGWPMMVFFTLAFWGLVAWAVITFVRGNDSPVGTNGPEEILARRFAAGEIDEDEYRQRLHALRNTQDMTGAPVRGAR